MASEPQTRYADAGGVKIAFQSGGSGPDLVMVPGFISHLELEWRDIDRRRFLRSIGRVSRLVRYDKRGTGLSDPVDHAPGLDERMEELDAVISASGCARPCLLGISEGGPIAIRYAVQNPARIRGLILYGTFARQPPPWAMDRARALIEAWGEGTSIDLFAPSLQKDEARRQERATMERGGASPAMARALLQALAKTNVLDLLPRVVTPTLVIHRRDEYIPLEAAEEIAAGIPGARLVVLEGRDHLPWFGDSDAVVGEVERFLREHAPTAPAPKRPMSRSRLPLTGWASLTPAELAVIRLVASGISNPEVARRLYLSRHTVEAHLKHSYAKLGISSRTELAGLFIRNT